MPFDPRMMMQMGQYGLGMLGPQGGAFGGGAPTDEQMMQQAMTPRSPLQMPRLRSKPMPPQGVDAGQLANSPANSPNAPDDPNAPPTPSLLQMLMLGGKPTMSGSPTPGAAPSGGNPWGWLGSMGMPGGAGWGGGGSAG